MTSSTSEDDTGYRDPSEPAKPPSVRKKGASWGGGGSSDTMGPPLTTKNLICWAFQVARGMEYLAAKKVRCAGVHSPALSWHKGAGHLVHAGFQHSALQVIWCMLDSSTVHCRSSGVCWIPAQCTAGHLVHAGIPAQCTAGHLVHARIPAFQHSAR